MFIIYYTSHNTLKFRTPKTKQKRFGEGESVLKGRRRELDQT